MSSDTLLPRGHAPGTMGNSLPEVDLGTGRTAVSLKAGGERTCAILDNGSLKVTDAFSFSQWCSTCL